MTEVNIPFRRNGRDQAHFHLRFGGKFVHVYVGDASISIDSDDYNVKIINDEEPPVSCITLKATEVRKK